MAESYDKALEVAVRAARLAGEFLRDAFHHLSTHPHLDFDKQAEELIRRELLAAFPDWGYRGEETGFQAARSTTGPVHYWLVDPNDGTSAYLKGYRSSAVSIALLRDGLPVLGVVNAFAAPDDDGDFFSWAEGCGPLLRNGKPVTRHPWPAELGSQTVVFVSQYGDGNSLANQKCVSPGRFVKVPGIAYRLALVAAGEGDAGVSSSGPGSWDYAAGHALLSSAGGALVNESGRPVTYTPDGISNTSLCFGGAPSLVEELSSRPWREAKAKVKPPEELYDLVKLEPGHAVDDPDRLRWAQGALLGQLAGDALGSLVEFRTAASISDEYPGGPRRLEDGGTWNSLAGQPTDDSELALMLARSIVAAGRYDPEEAAQAYIAWYRSHPFDIGNATSQALAAATEADVAEKKAGERMRSAASRSSQSNGSLMRISPLGIWGAGLPTEDLVEAARTDSELTHPNPVCQEACAVLVVALAKGVSTGAGPGEVYCHVLDWAVGSCRDLAVVDALRRAATEPPADYYRHQGWVLIALQNAFYQLLHAPSLEEGVVATVAAGGDTDTNGAIVGALLGAVHGRDAVPLQWKQMLLSCRPMAAMRGVHHPRPRHFWPVDAFELAERLLLAGR